MVIMVVSVIEITKIALLVTVRHAEPLMARMIRHDAIVRKCWGRGDGVITHYARGDGMRGRTNDSVLSPYDPLTQPLSPITLVHRLKRFASGSFVSNGMSAISSQSASGIGVVK
jgi:hypothetical protein